MNSFDKIDYSLRIGKYAERRMMVEVFRRLTPFGDLEDYEYVGFGSVWFSDFSLFHRSLGMRKMISIEGSSEARNRVEFNRPYKIQVETGMSGAILPNLDWNDRKIVWLDYDDPVAKPMLLDVRTVAAQAMSGTLLAVSVPCSFASQTRMKPGPGQTFMDLFRNSFDPGTVPSKAKDGDLLGWRFGNLSREMFLESINDALQTRALTGDALTFEEVCSFEYEDGAKMTTLVGLFVQKGEEQKLADCKFSTLDFAEVTGPIRIRNPKMTIKEIRHLEAQLPFLGPGPLEHRVIPYEQVARFTKFYRYFPKFVSVEA